MNQPKSFLLSSELHAYLVAHGTPPDEVQARLIAKTAGLDALMPGISRMQIAPEQGTLLTMLARLTGARDAIEIGTFTGYSSLCIARGLAVGGRLLCCDVNEKFAAIARRTWTEDGVVDRIDLRIAPALDTLRALERRPQFDLAFIDADKPGYISYHDEIVPRLRDNGLLLVDNVLWSGRVADAAATDDDTRAIRAYNDHAVADRRVDAVMLPIGDGLTFLRRNGR
jgi:caffeoyl-CoA O-methyltransferase